MFCRQFLQWYRIGEIWSKRLDSFFLHVLNEKRITGAVEKSAAHELSFKRKYGKGYAILKTYEKGGYLYDPCAYFVTEGSSGTTHQSLRMVS